MLLVRPNRPLGQKVLAGDGRRRREEGEEPEGRSGHFNKARRQASDRAQQVRDEEEDDEVNTDQCRHVRDEDGNPFAIDPGDFEGEEEDCWQWRGTRRLGPVPREQWTQDEEEAEDR